MWPTRPDFLVVSPPKTGSTWLADNLRRHPGLFVPDIKEVRYFSSLHRHLDLDWYLSHFSPAAGRRAGEASPSYAALPTPMIRRVRELCPDLKVVYLMRDPVGRAWSHVKHMHRYREGVFADAAAGPDADDRWRAALADDWPLVSGDYLGHLRRWTAVFPPGQVLVGFYEDIAARPVELLGRVFRFLGADPGIDLSAFPVRERILPGAPGDPSPGLTAFLRGLLGGRTAELAAFLRERFGLEVPAEWQTTLGPGAVEAVAPPPAFARAADDAYVAAVGGREEQFPTAYREVLLSYRGFDLVYYRGRLLAVDRAACGDAIPGADTATVDRLIATGACLAAPSLEDLKEQVTDRLLDRVAGRLAAVEGRLGAAEAEARKTAAALAGVVAELSRGSLVARVARRVRRLTGRAVARASR